MRRIDVLSVHASNADCGNLAAMVVSGDRVWAVGGRGAQSTVLYSRNRGESFTMWSGPGAIGLRGVWFELETVWVVGERGTIARTDAGDGETWTVLEQTVRPNCFYSIKRDSTAALVVLGDDGTMLRSKNGTHWSRVKTGTNGRIFDLWNDPGCTWLVDSEGTLLRSTKKGFVTVLIPAMRKPRPLCGLVRTPRGTLIAIGDGGMILRSTNDGASWKKIPIDDRPDLERIIVTRLGTFVIGDHGSLLVSYDDGQSFEGFESALADHLWSIVEVANGDLLVGGEGGQIWRISKQELGLAMRETFLDRDPVLAGLAGRIVDGDEGAELVLEDALRERELW